MAKFGKRSLSRLEDVHPTLVDLAFRVVTVFDVSIVYGVRDLTTQRHMVNIGASKTMNSMHLIQSATGYGHALDLIPYPFTSWDDLAQFQVMGGVVLTLAHEMGLKDVIRWGGAWRGGFNLNKEGEFMDLLHFEIKPGAFVSSLPV